MHGRSVTSLSLPGGYVLASVLESHVLVTAPLEITHWHGVSWAEPRLILCVSLSWSGHCLGSLDHYLPSTDLGSYSGLNKPKAPPSPATSLRKRSVCYMLDAALSGMLTSKLPMSAPLETRLVSRHQHLYLLQWLGECLEQEAQESTGRLEPPCSHCGRGDLTLPIFRLYLDWVVWLLHFRCPVLSLDGSASSLGMDLLFGTICVTVTACEKHLWPPVCDNTQVSMSHLMPRRTAGSPGEAALLEAALPQYKSNFKKHWMIPGSARSVKPQLFLRTS